MYFKQVGVEVYSLPIFKVVLHGLFLSSLIFCNLCCGCWWLMVVPGGRLFARLSTLCTSHQPVEEPGIALHLHLQSTCHCKSKITQGASDCIYTADQIVDQGAIPVNASSLRSCCDPPTHPLSATKDRRPKILCFAVVRVFFLAEDTNFVTILSPFERGTSPVKSEVHTVRNFISPIKIDHIVFAAGHRRYITVVNRSTRVLCALHFHICCRAHGLKSVEEVTNDPCVPVSVCPTTRPVSRNKAELGCGSHNGTICISRQQS